MQIKMKSNTARQRRRRRRKSVHWYENHAINNQPGMCHSVYLHWILVNLNSKVPTTHYNSWQEHINSSMGHQFCSSFIVFTLFIPLCVNYETIIHDERRKKYWNGNAKKKWRKKKMIKNILCCHGSSLHFVFHKYGKEQRKQKEWNINNMEESKWWKIIKKCYYLLYKFSISKQSNEEAKQQHREFNSQRKVSWTWIMKCLALALSLFLFMFVSFARQSTKPGHTYHCEWIFFSCIFRVAVDRICKCTI